MLCGTAHTEVDEVAADVEVCAESSPLDVGDLFLVIGNVGFLGGLGAAALGLKDDVETVSGRVDGDRGRVTAAVGRDLGGRVVGAVVHRDVVERTTARTHTRARTRVFRL